MLLPCTDYYTMQDMFSPQIMAQMPQLTVQLYTHTYNRRMKMVMSVKSWLAHFLISS